MQPSLTLLGTGGPRLAPTRLVNALLTPVYDKDHTWRGPGEPAFGAWAPIEARDVGVGEVTSGDGWSATAQEMRHGHGCRACP
jgi:hypothetical protein